METIIINVPVIDWEAIAVNKTYKFPLHKEMSKMKGFKYFAYDDFGHIWIVFKEYPTPAIKRLKDAEIEIEIIEQMGQWEIKINPQF